MNKYEKALNKIKGSVSDGKLDKEFKLVEKACKEATNVLKQEEIRKEFLIEILNMLTGMEQTWLKQKKERNKPDEDGLFLIMINTAQFIREQLITKIHYKVLEDKQ